MVNMFIKNNYFTINNKGEDIYYYIWFFSRFYLSKYYFCTYI